MVPKNQTKNILVYSVIILAVASLVVLMVIQIRWLEDATKVASLKFDDRVVTAMNSFLLSNEDFIISNFQNDIKDPELIGNELTTRLQFEFERVLMTSPFEFSVVDANQKVVMGNTNLKTNQCRFPLTCSHYLNVDFPEKRKFLYSELSKTMAPSILSILILAGSVFYIFYLFKKQKKISTIKNDFINNMTHEFKTPLATISLSSHVLKNSNGSKKESQTYFELIDLETKRLQTHIDKILQIAQLDAGNFDLEKEEVNLNEIIQKVIKSFNPLIRQHKLKIVTKLAEDSLIKGDEIHLTNVLYNLLDNAIKYSKSIPEVIISTVKESDKLILEVCDNGVGMDKNIQRHVFEKFFRGNTGNVHNVKGFGLGLNYVKSIIDAHKGVISLSSAPGKGTRFNIELPS